MLDETKLLLLLESYVIDLYNDCPDFLLSKIDETDIDDLLTFELIIKIETILEILELDFNFQMLYNMINNNNNE